MAAVCSRRAGKSFGLAYKILIALLRYNGCEVAYVCLTRERAKSIIWPALRDLCASIGFVEGKDFRFREDNGSFRLMHNKSTMTTFGCEDRRQLEKLRGAKYPLIVFDEAQAMPYYLLDAISDIAEPATMDYGAEGQILITGTPNAACAGAFHDITTGTIAGWEVHHWTFRDNPHIPDKEEWIAQKMVRSGWDEYHPTYLREYCGQWIRDEDGRVYKISSDVNVVGEWPEHLTDDWEFYLGVDLGYNDPSAFVVSAASESLGQMYALECHKESRMLASAVAVKILKYKNQYPISRVVVDTGGYGKSIAEELRIKHGIDVVAAEKQRKYAHIELLNSDLGGGQVKIVKPGCDDLISEMFLLQWDEASMATGKPKEDRRTPQHLCDALLYSWRDTHIQSDEWLENPPVIGSAEWAAAEEERMERSVLEKMKKEKNPFWVDDEDLDWHISFV